MFPRQPAFCGNLQVPKYTADCKEPNMHLLDSSDPKAFLGANGSLSPAIRLWEKFCDSQISMKYQLRGV